MTQQITIHKDDKKIGQSNLIGTDAKNTFPTTKLEITGADLIGLSWIFASDVDSEIC